MSTKQSQKDAVFSAITSVLAEAGIKITEGESVSSHMTRERRAQVTEILTEGFCNGTIELKETYDESKARTYASSLQSNWIRKDPRLNGGEKYSPKNPGSRVGSTDEQLKNLRLFFKTRATSEEKAEVQKYIDARVAELAASKVKNVEVNMDALPVALREKFSN